MKTGLVILLFGIFVLGCVDENGNLLESEDTSLDVETGSDPVEDLAAFETCLDEVAWYQANSGGLSHETRQKIPNAFGLYDMFGNVPEWVLDCYHETLERTPTDGSALVDNCVEDAEGLGTLYVLRGGGYGSSARVLRMSARAGAPSDFYGSLTPGFRCVRNSGTEDGGEEPTGLVWVEIPGGSIEMGCSLNDDDCYENELPVLTVNVKAFQMNDAEITQQQYFDHFGEAPNPTNYCPECAQDYATWTNAKDYCESFGARLPTEAEWEYAARSGTMTRYPCEED